jgi:Uma2 family endonuclease
LIGPNFPEVPTVSIAQTLGISPRRFTAGEVVRWMELGAFRDDEHIELIEGELVEVTPQGPLHRNLVAVLGTRLTRLYPTAVVSQSAPIDAGERNLPEPDVAVVEGGEHAFRARFPKGSETSLVVEVAHTSRTLDRAKAAIYARAGVPVYWLVDVVAKRVEVYEGSQPDGTYRAMRQLSGDDTLTPPGTAAAWLVRELFPE